MNQIQPKETIPQSLCDCINKYAEYGYATFPTQLSKAPLTGVKWKEASIDRAPNQFTYPYGCFGVRLKPDDLVIDLDPRNMQGRKVWTELRSQVMLEGVEEATRVQTGSGGWHIYLRKPAEFEIRKTLKQFPGIDFLSAGAYVVGAGSTGYDFITRPFKIYDAPSSLLNLLKRDVVDLGIIAHQGFEDSAENKGRYREYLESFAPVAVEGEGGDATTFKVACRGRDYNLTAGATTQLMLEYYNPKCQPAWALDELRRKVLNAYQYNEAPAGTRDPKVVFDGVEIKVDEVKWKAKMDSYKGGGYKPTLRNAIAILRKEMSIQGRFALNEFTEKLEVTGKVPWEAERTNRYRQVNDREIEHIRLYVAEKFEGVEFSSQTIWKAVDLVAANNVYHPIRDFIDKLKWDGVPRVDQWLTKYCGTADSPLTKCIGRKFLSAMVRRVYQPGCKFDYVLVLEGAQGIGKSTACAILGGDWYGDAPIDPKDKDTIPYIHSHWVIELSEMVTTKKADADRMKNFISRGEDDVRLPYARARCKYPRQCVFIGTVNPDGVGYLNDPTGNRRYWPVFCNSFDLEGLKQDRDQLIAEAKVISDQNELLTLPYELVKDSELEQSKRVADDPWQGIIEDWQATVPNLGEVTTQEVFRDVFNGSLQHMHTGHQRRIASSLQNLGWTKASTRKGNMYRRMVKVENN